MTELEKTFLEADDFLNDIGLRHFIHGSTLLGFVRNNKLLDRAFPNTLQFDREMNFGCYWEELNDAQIDAFQKRWAYIKILKGHKPHTLIWFGNDWDRYAFDGQNMGAFNNPNGFSLLNTYHKNKDIVFNDMAGTGKAKVWDKDIVGEADDWGEIEMFGRTFRTPAKPVEWFETYYGPDWMVERKNWRWTEDAKNLVPIEEVTDYEEEK